MVSLIIPSYRNPECLDICLQSALEGQSVKNEIIVIVHGFGEGILRATTQETLKNNSSVLKYRIFYNNPGCTIAKLIIDF
jgi:glycosyltransferase involved in cell wall biosynthesis